MYNGYNVTLCIPTLSEYDLLNNCIRSASEGSVKPDTILVMDNGGLYNYEGPENVEVFSYGYNIGVAKSWNYFIKNVPEIRIISNDDIEFRQDTIKVLLDSYTGRTIHGIGGIDSLNIFSLFVFPDILVNTIGLFDESISPNYAYFEDNDYLYRMRLANIGLDVSPFVDVGHYHSATLKHMNVAQTNEHHKKFQLARENYVRKWGGQPWEEKYTTPFNS